MTRHGLGRAGVSERGAPRRLASLLRHAPAGVAAVALLFGSSSLAIALQQLPDEPSPKSGTAQVGAQGVVSIGNGDLSWRVTQRTAPPPGNAKATVSDLGFLVVDTGVLLVEDLQDGQQERLPAGEATLTQAGDEQLRAALGSDDATYFDVALVEPSAEAEGGAGSLFASEPFPGTGARHDVDLLQDAVAPGATLAIPAGGLPTLVLVLDGAADVATEAGDIVSLATGEAVSLPGALTVTAGDTGAAVVAAVTGPAVPRLAGAAGTPAPARAIQPPQPAATPRAEGQRVVTAAATGTPEASAAETANADDDGDGLTNAEEVALNTDPALADTDEDGLTDGEEQRQFGTAPLAPDTDGDGVLDGDEVAQGSDPLDGGAVVPAEPAAPAETGVAPEETTATAVDSDGDGLEDSIELELGTDPSDPDTDDDGATDGTEYYTLQTGTRNPDSDGDGVSDGDEAINGTDPNDASSF